MAKMHVWGSDTWHRLPPHVFDFELSPHPSEVVGCHRVFGIVVTGRPVLQILEPFCDLLPAFLGAYSDARRDVPEHSDLLVEGRTVLLVKHVMNDAGRHLRRNIGCRHVLTMPGCPHL